ncbi:hypothetical protein [Polaribacter sp. Hel1_33_49]|uniref:hypothetical protein n=1 Tax=Polaribacter sp. Hel1_33_49 TaxID=1336803 RepID=UPI00052D4082|nr:hypothetical protein [Polaribacter sp. Hel1_33_49]KGL59339.1 hypothetical protein PHEL49_0194 [Polaribacter sp. Hel1_33_49]
MKNLKLNSILIILIVLFSDITLGQNITEKEASYVSLNVNFINDAVFMGRKDSIATPYLYPSILYHNKSGLYASGSFSYLTKSSESRIDLFLITAGYDFSIKKLTGDISFTKYFFNDDSYNVISEVEADLTASIIYDLDIINLGVTANTYFNKNNDSDFFLSSEVSHDFVSEKTEFQISPTIGIYFGTQNFYEEYYINNRFSSKAVGEGEGEGDGQGEGEGQGEGDGSTQTTTEVVIQESEKFNMMALEFSLPMWYVYDSFTFMFLPAIVLPQNSTTLIIDGIVTKENLDTTFYAVIGVSYRF